jgi:CheY-like chemotaxis protein
MITLVLPKTNEPAPALAEPGPQVSRQSHSVLVVDDEPSVAQAVATMLEGAGHSVGTASSAAAGLDLLANQRYDLLVTDITMPGMSGLDFALEARRRYPHVGVVLMSGYSTQLERGAKHPFPLLSKPFNEKELLASLAAEISRRSSMANVVSIDEVRRG